MDSPKVRVVKNKSGTAGESGRSESVSDCFWPPVATLPPPRREPVHENSAKTIRCERRRWRVGAEPPWWIKTRPHRPRMGSRWIAELPNTLCRYHRLRPATTIIITFIICVLPQLTVIRT